MSRPREPYITLSYPFKGPPQEISTREAREGMRRLMEQKGARIDLIREFLRIEGGLRLDVESELAEFDKLPGCIAALGGKRTKPESEIEAEVLQARVAIQAMIRAFLPTEDLDDQTYAMCFDAGLLWGECFIDKYPSASWSLGVGRKLYVDYHRPVIIGREARGPVFSPERELRGLVWHHIFDGGCRSTPSSIAEWRAIELGIA